MQRTSTLSLIFACAGPVYMLLAIANYVGLYKQRWEFGRYGMPHALVAADGQHYLDGSPVDSGTLQLIRVGCEEEFELAITLMIGVIVLLIIRQLQIRAKLLRQIEEMRRLTARRMR